MRFSRLALTLFMAMLACAACRPSLTPEKDLYDTLGQFSQGLRWGDYFAAARFFADPDHRADFIERYHGREDLNVTEVRLAQVLMSPEQASAEIVFDVEYFILPSATVEKKEIRQRWEMAGLSRVGRSKWVLKTAFPEIP